MAGKNSPLFSQTALEELNHSSKTDAFTNIISNWMWFLLVGISVATAAVMYWGFFGSMADSVQGVGVTVRRGGVDAIVARGSGIVETLNIMPGSPVFRENIVGHIYNSHDFFTQAKLELEYEQLRDYLDRIEKGTGKVSALAAESALEKEKELESLLEKLEQNRSRNQEIAEMYHRATASHAATKMDYYTALEQTLQVESNLSSILQEYMDSVLSRSNIEWDNEHTLLSGQRDRQLKGQEMELAAKMFQDSAWLRSDSEGVVIEVLKDVGDSVVMGEKIALVSTSKFPELRVVGFVPIEQGKKVQPGMSVFYSPSSFNPREYGYIQGVVLETSPFAVSSASIETELKNPDLARSIARSSVQMRVVVELIPDRNAPSKYKWTSRNGAPSELEAGSYGTLLINTESRSPASYVVPFLRKTFLGVGKEHEDAVAVDARGNRP